jgi:D-psicose/D-tagatose/L-ribulose 3-epimerase
MKFGVNTFIWSATYDRTIQELLPPIGERGFDGVEVPLFRPAEFPASTIRRDTEANGLECTICCVLVDGLSLIDEDADIRRKTQSHLRSVIQAGAEAGAKIIAGPIYCPVGYLPGRRRTADEWRWAVEGYQSLTSTLEANKVTLAVEPLNRFETFFLNTASDAAALCDQVGHPSVGVLFDTFHANIEEKNIAEGYLTVGKHLRHVHTCENDRGTPGSGHVDWAGVFRALAELGYDGWLTIESFGFALGDLSAAASIWRDIEITPDSIAFDGVRFLREQVAAHVIAVNR